MICVKCFQPLNNGEKVVAEFTLIYHEGQALKTREIDFSGIVQHINCKTIIEKEDPK